MKYYKALVLLLCISTIWVNYKMYNSSLFQSYIMFDYNQATFYAPIDLVMDIDNEFPNVTLTTLPIKFLQARYYEEIDSIEIAKKLYYESMSINPYLTASEAELAGLYFNQKMYDSAYYYSKIAFDNIPNSNVHRHALFEVLKHRKDTLELMSSFETLKQYDNDNHWKEFMLYMYQILGPNNKTVMDTFEEYKIRFNKSNDKPTDVLESILKVGSNNVVASVSISLKADSLFNEKNYLSSAKLYELALEIDKTDYIFYENAAIAYNLAGDYNKAKNYFDRVIDGFKPLDGKSEFYKGLMLIKLNEMEEGCLLLKRAVELNYSGEASLKVYNNFCN